MAPTISADTSIEAELVEMVIEDLIATVDNADKKYVTGHAAPVLRRD